MVRTRRQALGPLPPPPRRRRCRLLSLINSANRCLHITHSDLETQTEAEETDRENSRGWRHARTMAVDGKAILARSLF